MLGVGKVVLSATAVLGAVGVALVHAGCDGDVRGWRWSSSEP